MVPGLADIGIGEIELNYDRREAVDLTYPYIIDDITFTSPPPKLYQTTMNIRFRQLRTWLMHRSPGICRYCQQIYLETIGYLKIRHLNITQELANI
ncbi:unnamed protein product [Oppiella nova]|uniref:Uncharacterized protein n=1 Tax=Oppiella nova TaxID=334625 RepID=A0A7R9LUD1_9ACAR|nr:unnamed protein product [Oppiella nova]CAG2167060.1 unnamed protein product [Oppiella nova]